MTEPTPPTKSSQIGLRQLPGLANLPPSERLAMLAEGLPIILESAQNLLAASESLEDHPRSAEILRRHGEEEAAKILILMDYVRCPLGRSDWAAAMLRAFYDHGARLIYADACNWKPTDVAMLQGYVDSRRQSHYVEGPNGDWIVPNWDRHTREALLYADLARFDSGQLGWNEPRQWATGISFPPPSVAVGGALSRLGAFTPSGLEIVAGLWGAVEFSAGETSDAALNLTRATVEALEAAGVLTEEASAGDVRRLYGSWQLPMYSLDFKIIEVPLAELRDEQEQQFYANFT